MAMVKAIEVEWQSDTGAPAMAISGGMLNVFQTFELPNVQVTIFVQQSHRYWARHTVESFRDFALDRPAFSSSLVDVIDKVSKCFRF